LIKGGVPSSSITLENKSHNTKENAEFTSQWLKDEHVNKAIIVTTWFHCRRAQSCFQHFAPGIQFACDPADDPATATQRITHIYLEYIKVVWYCLRYRISPFRR